MNKQRRPKSSAYLRDLSPTRATVCGPKNHRARLFKLAALRSKIIVRYEKVAILQNSDRWRADVESRRSRCMRNDNAGDLASHRARDGFGRLCPEGEAPDAQED